MVKKLINSDLTKVRKAGPQTLSLENENGDVVVFTPFELKDILRSYINEEFYEFTKKVSKEQLSDLETIINVSVNRIEVRILDLLNDKIDQLCEKIIPELTNSSLVDKLYDHLIDKLENNKKKRFVR